MEKMNMDAAIEINNLTFAIETKKILDSVSFAIQHKQTIGLIGPNGSGKTTLLKHLYRSLIPQANTVFINGTAIEQLSYQESARMLTVMKQESTNEFTYSVFEMVLMGRSPYRQYYESDTKEDKQIAYNALKFLGMEQFAQRDFATLSGGEKQRVLIARSLAQEAEILILDEPTNHLDVHYQWALMDIIKKMNKTVLSVFHELNLAANFCDYIFVLANGSIVAQGTPRELYTPKLFADVFRIEADVIFNGTVPYILYKRAIVS
ncbi:MAG: ABC transporter ATP-binding protein [Treponema sp.]